MESLHELLIDQLSDLHSAEQQLVQALPIMIDAAASAGLRMSLEEHLTETKNQVTRLERAFEEMGEHWRRQICASMAALIQEASDVSNNIHVAEVKDAALIGATQKIEHYEIAAYGFVRSLAATLSLPEIADLLQQSLDEESNADKRLSDLALSAVNQGALSASE